MALATQTSAILRFDTFEVDVRLRELRKQGKRIRLQEQPFQLLVALLQQPGDVVSREALRSQIWGQATFVDFDNNLNAAVNKLREALGDFADNPRFIETLPRRGYRFIAPVTSNHQEKSNGLAARRKIAFPLAVTAVVAACIAGGVLWHSRQSRPLTGKNTVVLADFTNSTGDPVFDGTLREGLAVQLEQSPFLSLVSDEGIHRTLRMMGQSANARLTPEVAREVCQRMGGDVVLDGSIAQVGTRYHLILKTLNCFTGDSLASAESQSGDKSHVLDALRNVASEMRKKLGESSNTVQKYNAPLEQVTTPSLEALQAYTLGWEADLNGNESAAVGAFERAISPDSNFAMAHAALGNAYGAMGETRLAAENTRTAYDLRDRVSQCEKFYISSHYEENVTGDLEKAIQIFELWVQAYPRDVVPVGHLGFDYSTLGQYDKSLAAGRRALELAPDRELPYELLVSSYIGLDRLGEAADVLQQAKTRGIDSPPLHEMGYGLAFLVGDTTGMAREEAWAVGMPATEALFLFDESDSQAYAGHLAQANALTRGAIAMARQAGEKETAASYLAEAALRQALVGNSAEARKQASAALRASNGRETEATAALALALAGDLARAQRFADDLAKRFPRDTVTQFNYLPTIHSAIALGQKSPAKAIAHLQAAAPYELGTPAIYFGLSPVYVRGQAFLAAQQGAAAAAEFQKILDHPGIVTNELIFPLAYLGLGRARSVSGDTLGAGSAYQNFLTLWQSADPDVPLLKRAKSEYAKLR